MNEKLKEELRKELEEKVRKLTKEEIRDMLIISTKCDTYSAKCFAFLLLEYKEIVLNKQQYEILEEFIDLLSSGRNLQAIELINEKY